MKAFLFHRTSAVLIEMWGYVLIISQSHSMPMHSTQPLRQSNSESRRFIDLLVRSIEHTAAKKFKALYKEFHNFIKLKVPDKNEETIFWREKGKRWEMVKI